MTREQIDAHLAAHTITARQAEILHLRRRGFSLNQIALGLSISRESVRSIERAGLTNITNRKEPA